MVKKIILKVIGSLLSIAFIGFVSFILIIVAQASRTNAYMDGVREETKTSDEFLLSAITTANTQGKSKSYILRNPIFEQSFHKENPLSSVSEASLYHVDIKVYALCIFDKKTSSNYFAIIFKNLQAKENGVLTDEDGVIIMSVKFLFDREIKFGKNFSNTNTTQLTPVYGNETYMLLINSEVLKDSNGSEASIDKLDIFYKVDNNERKFLSLTQFGANIDLSEMDAFGNFNSSRLFDFSGNNIRLNKIYKTAQDNEYLYYLDSSTKQYKTFNYAMNGYIVALVFIYLLFAIPVLYLILFLDVTIKKIKIRRAKRIQDF
jgi:hypothetical protein